MVERKSRERAPGIGVGVRRALAREVRREENAVCARRRLRSVGQQLLVACAEDVAQPAERAGGREHHAHRVPGVRDGVAERMHSRLRVGGECGQGREHDTGRAEHDRQAPGPVDPDAERSGRLVAGAADRRALVRVREPGERQLEQLQHLGAPTPPRDVEEQRPGGVGRVDRALPGEPEADVVLGEQDVRDPRIDVGLVPAQPEQLRRSEPGERAVAGQLDQAAQPDALLDLGALRGGALVVPENRRPQHRVVVAERDEAVHLARVAERIALAPAELGQRRTCSPATSPPGLARPTRAAGSRAGTPFRLGRAPLRPARSRSP